MAQIPSLADISRVVLVQALLGEQEGKRLRSADIKCNILRNFRSGDFSAISTSVFEKLVSEHAEKLSDEILLCVLPVHLKCINLTKCTRLTASGIINALSKSLKVDALNISETNIFERLPEVDPHAQFLPKVPELDGLNKLADTCTHLTSLSLAGMSSLQTEHVQLILERFANLTHLNVSSCSSLGDRAFLVDEQVQLARETLVRADESLPWPCVLTSIDVSCCQQLSSSAVRHITSLCGPTLRRVNISYTSIDSTALWYLSGYNLLSSIRKISSTVKKYGFGNRSNAVEDTKAVIEELRRAAQSITNLLQETRQRNTLKTDSCCDESGEDDNALVKTEDGKIVDMYLNECTKTDSCDDSGADNKGNDALVETEEGKSLDDELSECIGKSAVDSNCNTMHVDLCDEPTDLMHESTELMHGSKDLTHKTQDLIPATTDLTFESDFTMSSVKTQCDSAKSTQDDLSKLLTSHKEIFEGEEHCDFGRDTCISSNGIEITLADCDINPPQMQENTTLCAPKSESADSFESQSSLQHNTKYDRKLDSSSEMVTCNSQKEITQEYYDDTHSSEQASRIHDTELDSSSDIVQGCNIKIEVTEADCDKTQPSFQDNTTDDEVTIESSEITDNDVHCSDGRSELTKTDCDTTQPALQNHTSNDNVPINTPEITESDVHFDHGRSAITDIDCDSTLPALQNNTSNVTVLIDTVGITEIAESIETSTLSNTQFIRTSGRGSNSSLCENELPIGSVGVLFPDTSSQCEDWGSLEGAVGGCEIEEKSGVFHCWSDEAVEYDDALLENPLANSLQNDIHNYVFSSDDSMDDISISCVQASNEARATEDNFDAVINAMEASNHIYFANEIAEDDMSRGSRSRQSSFSSDSYGSTSDVNLTDQGLSDLDTSLPIESTDSANVRSKEDTFSTLAKLCVDEDVKNSNLSNVHATHIEKGESKMADIDDNGDSTGEIDSGLWLQGKDAAFSKLRSCFVKPGSSEPRSENCSLIQQTIPEIEHEAALHDLESEMVIDATGFNNSEPLETKPRIPESINSGLNFTSAASLKTVVDNSSCDLDNVTVASIFVDSKEECVKPKQLDCKIQDDLVPDKPAECDAQPENMCFKSDGDHYRSDAVRVVSHVKDIEWVLCDLSDDDLQVPSLSSTESDEILVVPNVQKYVESAQIESNNTLNGKEGLCGRNPVVDKAISDYIKEENIEETPENSKKELRRKSEKVRQSTIRNSNIVSEANFHAVTNEDTDSESCGSESLVGHSSSESLALSASEPEMREDIEEQLDSEPAVPSSNEDCVGDAFLTDTEEEEALQLYQPNLASLDISCISTHSKELMIICIKQFFESNGSIQHLGMSWQDLDDQVLDYIASHTPDLQHVNLIDCIGLRSHGVASLCSKCPKLTSLVLRRVNFIGDLALTPLMDGRGVTRLNLAETNITDVTLHSLAEKFPQLTNLDLSWCEELMAENQHAMEHLLQSASQLQKLKLRHLSLGDTCLFSLAKHCLDLHTLNVTNVGLNDSHLLSIALQCKHLTNLDVSWNSDLTDVGCGAAMANLVRLQSVDMTGIKLLTTAPFLPIIIDLPRWRKCQAFFKFKQKETLLRKATGLDPDSSDEEYEALYMPCRSAVYAPRLNTLLLEYADRTNDKYLSELVAICRGTLQIKDYYGCWVTPKLFH